MELEHAEFDDLIGAGGYAGGFCIEDDAGEGVFGRVPAEPVLLFKATQHAVMAARLKDGGKAFQDNIHEAIHSMFCPAFKLGRARLW